MRKWWRQQRPRRLPGRIPPEAHDRIVNRVKAGETYQSVSETFGVTREAIRLVCLKYGVRSVRGQYRMRESVRAIFDEVETRRVETWAPLVDILDTYDMNPTTFRRIVAREPDLHERWVAMGDVPRSRLANPQGRICVVCGESKGWDQYHKDGSHWTGYSQRCKPCNIALVGRYYKMRHYPSPTVTEKRCPGCGVTKTAGDYHRSTHSTTGLQVRCKSCQAVDNKRSGARRAAADDA